MGSSTQSSHVSSLGSVESEGEELMSSSLGKLPDPELILGVRCLSRLVTRDRDSKVAHFF